MWSMVDFTFTYLARQGNAEATPAQFKLIVLPTLSYLDDKKFRYR